MPCALPFAGPCGPQLVPALLSCTVGELRILPESQGLSEGDDGVDPLQALIDIKG